MANQRRYVARVIQTSEIDCSANRGDRQRRTGGVSVRHCVSHSCSCCGHWRCRSRSLGHSHSRRFPCRCRSHHRCFFFFFFFLPALAGSFQRSGPLGDLVEEVGGTLARFVALLNQDEFIDDRRGVLPPVPVRLGLEDGDHPADRRRHRRRRHRGPMPCSTRRGWPSAPSSSAPRPDAMFHTTRLATANAATPTSHHGRRLRGDRHGRLSLTPVSRCWMLATFGLVVADGEVFFGPILRLSPRRCFASHQRPRLRHASARGFDRCPHLDDVVASARQPNSPLLALPSVGGTPPGPIHAACHEYDT